MKGGGGDGEIKGRVKGTKGGDGDKSKREGGGSSLKKADERMERWFLSFSVPFPSGGR